METRSVDLPFDPASVPGLSEKLLRSHHRNNYGCAVRRLNALRGQLAALDLAAEPGFRINGLKREELIAANSVVLHELYFASLAAAPTEMAPACALALRASFGSVDRWRAEFVAMGKALAGGSGWVVLTFQPRDGGLVNVWAADHTHALAGGTPLLALDMYEHAYHLDYGADAAAYVDAFMAAIDWPGVYARYQAAVAAASQGFDASHDDVANALVLDVRRDAVFDAAPTMLPGAQWRDLGGIDTWAADLPADRDVVVYCVYGHEVGRAAALRLRALGVRARFLQGGIDGWQTAGRAVTARR